MIDKLSYCLRVSLLCLFCSFASVAVAQTSLIRFQHTPFPYKELTPLEKPFFDINEQGRRGHQSSRAGIYWEDETYNDNRVLISIPPQFHPGKSALIIVYLHGNEATLERDVRDRQQIPAQVIESGMNAVLVAPQFALNALDSSPGNFMEKNYFKKFLLEAAERVGQSRKNRAFAKSLKNAKVIIVAYSGGYQAAAAILENGGANNRIAGVILLDALYGREQIFANLLTTNPGSFLISSFTEAARTPNENLKAILKTNSKKVTETLPEKILPGTTSFLSLGPDVDHYTLLEGSWTEKPLANILRRVNLAGRK